MKLKMNQRFIKSVVKQSDRVPALPKVKRPAGL